MDKSISLETGVSIFPEDLGDEDCKKIFYSVCDKTGKELSLHSTIELAYNWIKENGKILVANFS